MLSTVRVVGIWAAFCEMPTPVPIFWQGRAPWWPSWSSRRRWRRWRRGATHVGVVAVAVVVVSVIVSAPTSAASGPLARAREPEGFSQSLHHSLLAEACNGKHEKLLYASYLLLLGRVLPGCLT